MAGICSVGANAIFVGVMPTPATAYLTRKHKLDAGVVISASHNPMEFNGIKFFNGEGYKLPDEMEDEIESLIKNNMKDVVLPIGSGVGKIDYRFDLRDEYVKFMEKCVPVDLKGMKIVVDCAEGASHYTSVKALTDLGADLIAIHTDPDGTNINSNCGSTHMDELKARVVYEKAAVGLAFDGDADRMLAVDEHGSCGRRSDHGNLWKLHEVQRNFEERYDRSHSHDKPRIYPYGAERGHPCGKDKSRRPLCS